MRIQIPKAFAALAKPKRYKIFYGGRGGAKSESIARQAILNAVSRPNGFRMLCGREFQNSMDDSVHGLLASTIEIMGVTHLFDVQATAIYGINNSVFRFMGLSRNITSIKSKHNYDAFWAEEAESITQKSWDTIIPTFRKSGSEIWVSFNPKDEKDATYKEFVTPFVETIKHQGFYEDADYYVRLVTYRDNPFFPKELRDHAERLKRENYKKWLHIYEGKPDMSYEDSIIEPEWFDAAIDAHKKLKIHLLGERAVGFDPADEGTDNKALVCREGILIERLEQWTDGDLNDGIHKAFQMTREYNASYFTYDNVGNGAGVKVYLKHNVKPYGLNIHGFGGAESVDDPHAMYQDERKNKEMFKNKRAQYYWLLRDRFFKTYLAVAKGMYQNPVDLISLSSDLTDLADLKSELVRIQRKRGAGVKVQIESKEEMRKRGMESPNLADALTMSFANRLDDDDDFMNPSQDASMARSAWA